MSERAPTRAALEQLVNELLQQATRIYETCRKREQGSGEEARFLRGVAAGHEESAHRLLALLDREDNDEEEP